MDEDFEWYLSFWIEEFGFDAPTTAFFLVVGALPHLDEMLQSMAECREAVADKFLRWLDRIAGGQH